MNLLALADSLNRLAADNRIGTPVSLRLIHADGGQSAEQLLEGAVAVAAELFGSELRTSCRHDSADGQRTSLQLLFEAGQTALLSIAAAPQGESLFAAMLVGTQGIACWEPGSAAAFHCSASGEAGPVITQMEKRGARLHSPQGIDLPGGWHGERSPQPADPVEPPYGLLLIAGAYTHQEQYVREFLADPRIKLIGLADAEDVSKRRQSLNEQFARELDIPLLPLAEALRRDDVHLVSICAEPDRRAPLVEQCAQAGKHLYLDKPLCATVAEADAILAAIGDAGVYHQMFSLVHTGWAQRARRLVQSGELGDILAIHCDALFAKGPAGTAELGKPRQESAVPQLFEGATTKRELYNVGVYSLVLLHWLLKRPVRSVWATTANYFFAEHQQHDMEDFAQVVLTLEGDVQATLSAGRTGWCSHPAGGVHQAVFVGSRKTAVIDAYRPRLSVWADETPWPKPPCDPEDPMGFWWSTLQKQGPPKRAWQVIDEATPGDAEHFLNCLERGEASDVPAELAAAANEVLLACYQSAATGKPVRLPLPR